MSNYRLDNGNAQFLSSGLSFILAFMRIFLPLLSILFLLSLNGPALAVTGKGKPAIEQNHARVRLISNVTGTRKGGSVFLGVDVALEAGWDTYWRMPGEAGLPPTFDWSGSENIETPIVFWPVPQRITISGFDNFGYTGRVTFPALVKIKEAGKKALVKLKLDLLLCKNICLPQSYMLMLELPAAGSSPSPEAHLIGRAFSFIPVTVPPAHFKPDKIWVGDRGVEIIVKTEKMPQWLDVFIENQDQLALGRPTYDLIPSRGELAIHVPPAKNATTPLPDIKNSLAKNPPTVTFATDGVKVESKMTLSEAPPATVRGKILGINLALIGLALLGGLILNLMPCVLPVLSLKLLSALKLGENEQGDARRGFMAGAAGIIASFWLLAGLLVAAKAAGGAIGWGIQFQNPWFLGFLIAVILLFAVNLAGFFEIPLPRFIAGMASDTGSRHTTATGHFLTGMFATLLATPCSAPFLGTAIGFALASGTMQIMVIFTFMGIGLALPWLVFTASPGLARRLLPRPGRWMITLRKFLAFLLLITALWLASVLFAVIDPKTRSASAGWDVFAEEKIAPALAQGKIVFVDVTADWCLTCKANKKFVVESAAVQSALKDKGVLLLKADWTRRDETIRAFLEKHGRFGIPFNIVYGPNAPQGLVLSELLTEQAVLDALNRASSASR